MDLDDAQISVTAQLPITDEVARVVFRCDDGGCAGTILHTIDVRTRRPKLRSTRSSTAAARSCG